MVILAASTGSGLVKMTSARRVSNSGLMVYSGLMVSPSRYLSIIWALIPNISARWRSAARIRDLEEKSDPGQERNRPTSDGFFVEYMDCGRARDRGRPWPPGFCFSESHIESYKSSRLLRYRIDHCWSWIGAPGVPGFRFGWCSVQYRAGSRRRPPREKSAARQLQTGRAINLM